MKKTILIFALLLTAAIGVQAQSLIGTWKTDPTKDDDGDITTFYLIFKQGNKMDLKMVMTSTDADVGTITFNFNIPGTYTYKAKALKLDLNTTKAKSNFDIKFTPAMEKELKESPEVKDMILKMLKEQADQVMKTSMSDVLPFSAEMKVTTLTNTTLVLLEDDDETVLKRVQ